MSNQNTKTQETSLRVMVRSLSPEVDEIIDRTLAEFEESHDVSINLVRVLSPEIYWGELLAHLESEVPPDFIWVHDDMVTPLVEKRHIIELDSIVVEQPQAIQGIPPAVLERFRYESRLYGIPFGARGEFALNAFAISSTAKEFKKADLAFELFLVLRSRVQQAGVEAIVVSKAEEALQRIQCYRLRIERNDGSGYVSEAEVDIENKAIHSIIRVGLESPREVEFYWIGKKGYGLPGHIGTWFQVWVPGEPSSRLNAIFAILKTGEITTVKEESLEDERCWLLSVTPDLSLLRSNAQEYAESFSPAPGEGSESQNEKLRAQLERGLREVEMRAQFWISRETYYIKKAVVETRHSGTKKDTTYHIGNINATWLEIFPPAEATEAEGPPMSLGILFAHLAGFKGGWLEYNHCIMTQEALKLIEKTDSKGKYSEIYEGWGGFPYYTGKPKSQSKPGKTDHPCVQGAWAEDAGDEKRDDFAENKSEMVAKNFRDFRHFGGEDKGLKWEDYFKLRSTDKVKVEKPKNGVRYISAKNWGYSGADGDKMNFLGAIEAYNYYTPKGYKEAYYRMGHVLHLLQDVAQPDHASLKDHAGSAKTEREAYDEFVVCLAKAANTLEIESYVCVGGCGLALFGYWACVAACELAALYIALKVYEICEVSIDPGQVGFERLIQDRWDLNRIDKKKELKIKPEVSYDAYFKNLAIESIAELTEEGRNLKCPLGLGSLYVGLLTAGAVKIKGYSVKPFGTIPGVDPDIELSYPVGTGKDKPYLELADRVIVKAINKSAGLLQYFYEIVNHPPYVKSVTVAQGAFGLSVVDVLAKPQNFIYSADWKDEYVKDKLGDRISGRKLVMSQDEPISKVQLQNTQRIYVVAHVANKMKQLTLELKNCYGDPIDKCSMKDVTDSISSYYGDQTYFADFAVPIVESGISKACDALVLEFTGEDAEPHYSNRTYAGNELDSDPSTAAMVTTLPYHSPNSWMDYKPGPDTTHRIRIISADKHETKYKDSIADPTLINYPSGFSPLGLLQFSDLTLHESSDIDFFLLQLPQKTPEVIECEKAGNLPQDVSKLPGSLFISIHAVDYLGHAYSSGGLPIITFYKPDGSPLSQSQIPVAKSSSGVVASAVNKKVEEQFPDGKVLFSIKAEAGKKICYRRVHSP